MVDTAQVSIDGLTVAIDQLKTHRDRLADTAATAIQERNDLREQNAALVRHLDANARFIHNGTCKPRYGQPFEKCVESAGCREVLELLARARGEAVAS